MHEQGSISSSDEIMIWRLADHMEMQLSKMVLVIIAAFLFHLRSYAEAA
jgi:hypothetical protein